jgi:SAM-dependent methyltransferase
MDISEARVWNNHRRHPWELARVKVLEALLASRPERSITPQSLVADIGCGDAFIINRLNAKFPGARFIGVDTALAADEAARASSPSVGLYASVGGVPRNAAVSHVLLLDVLEHVSDATALLRQVCTELPVTESTWFIVTVPAFERLFSRHDAFLGHYRRYSRKTLRETLAAAGMEIDESGYFFASLLVPRLFGVACEKFFPASADSRSDLLKGEGLDGAVAELVRRMLIADYHLGAALRRIGLQPPGLSVFAVCRKSA